MPDNFRKFLLFWFPLLIYITLIFIVSSLSRPPLDNTLAVHDKLLHLAEYALLATLILRALGSWNRLNYQWVLIIISMLSVGVLGALDEWYQSIVPGRDSDIFDWVADLVGGLLGIVAYSIGRHILFSKAISSNKFMC